MEKNKPISILHVGKLVTTERECLCVVHSLSPREALVRASLPLSPGQSVLLGLRNGFTVPAIVGIIQGDQISLIFEEHVSISTILAEQRNGREEREAVRLSIARPISIVTPHGTHSCMMQDISLFGMKVLDEAGLLQEATPVQLIIEGLGKRDATVRWRQQPYAGMVFKVALGFKLLDQWAAQIDI
jgi:PilZ domain